MTETITITHHQTKPEYDWEIVIPEGPTVLLPDQALGQALHLLGVNGNQPIQAEIQSLPNGGSRSLDATIDKAKIAELVALGVKSVG